jgi:hypothetical protein
VSKVCDSRGLIGEWVCHVSKVCDRCDQVGNGCVQSL